MSAPRAATAAPTRGSWVQTPTVPRSLASVGCTPTRLRAVGGAGQTGVVGIAATIVLLCASRAWPSSRSCRSGARRSRRSRSWSASSPASSPASCSPPPLVVVAIVDALGWPNGVARRRRGDRSRCASALAYGCAARLRRPHDRRRRPRARQMRGAWRSRPWADGRLAAVVADLRSLPRCTARASWSTATSPTPTTATRRTCSTSLAPSEGTERRAGAGLRARRRVDHRLEASSSAARCSTSSRRGAGCVVTCNYRLSPRATWPDHVVDVKRALAWTREHAGSFGGDPARFLAISGNSAGRAPRRPAALTPDDRAWQPGFEDADTSRRRVRLALRGPRHDGRPDERRAARVARSQSLLGRSVMKVRLDDARDVYEAASPIAPDHRAAHRRSSCCTGRRTRSCRSASRGRSSRAFRARTARRSATSSSRGPSTRSTSLCSPRCSATTLGIADFLEALVAARAQPSASVRVASASTTSDRVVALDELERSR